MQTKLQELTKKIYSEGVEKGNEEAEKIINNAKNEAQSIINDAKTKAESIIKEAEKKNQELNENTKSELKMASKQILNTIKQNIISVINKEIISSKINEAIADKTFIKKTIELIASNWKIDDASSANLEIILPEDKKTELDNYLKKEATELLKKGISINYSNGLKSGFQIGPKDGGYKVSFSEEEFENYFKDFLRPKLVELLFGE